MNEKITSLSDLSIKRPVLATVMSLVIVFAGVLAFFKLPVREYPDIDPPVVTITTVYPGASSKVIETEITDILEEEIASVEGIRTMISASRDQVSTITVEFVLERDIDIAAQDLRDKISRVARKLPENADNPIIAKADSDAQPVMWIGVQSDERNLLDLAEYVDREIKNYFQNIPGVSKVIFGGEKKRSIQVLVDPKKLAYYNLTPLDLERSLKANNIELPAGLVESVSKEFSINIDAKLVTLEDYEELIIRDSGSMVDSQYRSGVIRLKDVADLRVGAENDRSFVRFNGQQGFGLGIVRQAKSNTIKISYEANKLINKLQAKIPSDIRLWVGFDSAQFIRLSLKELYGTIAQATLLVLLVIFVFLRNIRSTLIPGLAIPVSLIGVMIGIQLMGFTINQMTLLGLIIAIGIVVDDSIIVLENIYRHIEEGMEPKAAAKKGAEEITLAVVATTAVLIAIFLPVAFLSGITGRLLSEFAFSLCFATSISSFVALSLAPMLCSKVFRSKAKRLADEANSPKTFYRKLLNWFELVFNSMDNFYSKVLEKVLSFKKTFSILILVVCIPVSVLLFKTLPKDFIPDEDRGTFFVIFQAPTGSNLDFIDKQIRKAEQMLSKIPEVKTTISVAAFGRDAPGKVNEGIVIVRLIDWAQRAKNVFAIVGPLYPQLFMMPEAFALPIVPKSGPDSGFGAQPIQLVIKSNDLDFLVKSSAIVTQNALSLPTILFARSNLSLDKPELTVKINRDKALSLGISMEDISRSVELLFAGVNVTDFNDNGKKYEVYLKLPRDQKSIASKIGEFAVRSSSGALVQLSNLITIEETVGAAELNHYNRKKSVTIQASPKAGFTPSAGLVELETLARKLVSEMNNLPPDLEFDYVGTSKEIKDSNAALYFGFLVALLFAFLFLAGQFESFLTPIIIMLTVPLALVGALLGIYAFQFFPWITQVLIRILGQEYFWLQYVIPQFKNISINLYSQVGMIMLIGMATKNGILLVEFMNQLRDDGMKVLDAVLYASRQRLRPILMTAVSTVLGLLPVALALGIGTESRQSLGVVIIFGMTFSTLLTLFLIPCAYGILVKDKNNL
jgi:multidrug efflux pump